MARIKKTRPALIKSLMWSDIESNTKKKRNKNDTPILTLYAVTEKVTSILVFNVQKWLKFQKQLQISSIKRTENCKTKIIKNLREKELFTS